MKVLALVVLAAAVAACVATETPQQIRLALSAGSDAETRMTVVFATSNATLPSYQPIVQYGIGSTSGAVASCESYNYTHEPLWENSIFTHVCKLSDLTPATTYSYRVGSANDVFSDVLTFTTAPPAGSEGVNIAL